MDAAVQSFSTPEEISALGKTQIGSKMASDKKVAIVTGASVRMSSRL